MKRLNQVKKYAKKAIGALAVTALSLPAFAETAADPFTAIDLAGVAVKIGAAGLLIVGITMAYKSITLAKRAVNKA